MGLVDLNQFASLFEIGFALHIAVAFLERIHAKQLPVRLKKISAKAKSLEQLKKEISEGLLSTDDKGEHSELRLAYRTVENPIWSTYNNQVLDRIYALAQDTKGQIRALKRILNTITFLSILLLFYSVAMLFMMGLELDIVTGLDPLTASAMVLMQLLPLPICAVIFFFVARHMSREVDRKIRGLGELRLILNEADTSHAGYATVDQIYRREQDRKGFFEDN